MDPYLARDKEVFYLSQYLDKSQDHSLSTTRIGTKTEDLGTDGTRVFDGPQRSLQKSKSRMLPGELILGPCY